MASREQTPARGYKENSKSIVIAISFDNLVFANIAERAKANKRSFREEVRRLVDFALAKGA